MRTTCETREGAPRGWSWLLCAVAATGLAMAACEAPGAGGGGGLYIPPNTTAGDASRDDATAATDAVTTDGLSPDAGKTDAAVPDTTVSDTAVTDGGPVADALTDVGPSTTTIPDLQLAAEEMGCDPAKIVDGAQVALSGVVVTSPKFDAYTPTDPTKTALDGYFVEDPAAGGWSGLVVVVDRALATNFSPGDLVDIVGEHQEFYCLTQVEASQMSLSGTTAVPAPTELPAVAVLFEENEGRLIRIPNVLVLAEAAAGVYDVESYFQVAHKFDFYLKLEVGKTYDLVGVLGYSYGNFQLYPRSDSDVTAVGGPTPDTSTGDTSTGDTGGGDVGPAPVETTIAAVNQSTESVDCASASIQDVSDPLTVEGTILMGPIDLASTLWGYVITDGTMGPWGGLVVTWPKSTPGTFSPGDKVRFTGVHVEYYCQTEFKAESGVVTGSGSGFEVPEVTGDAGWEQWEGSLVQVPNVTVTGDADWATYGDLELDNGLVLDDWIAGPGVIQHPGVGTTLSAVAGVIHYAFGRYRIAPPDNGALQN